MINSLRLRWFAALLLLSNVGCGQTGPLYLPGTPDPAVAPPAGEQPQGSPGREEDEDDDR